MILRSFIGYIFFFLIVSSCVEKTSSTIILEKVMKFPKKMDEVSGIIYKSNSIFCIEDSGNLNSIYKFNLYNNDREETQVNTIENIDWEAITSDQQGNLYIGDFGNNANDRKNLSIYKLSSTNLSKVTAKISFNYPEQTDFPAKKGDKLYDCEAFFHYQNALYLFTKNRSKGFDGTSLLYKIPAIEGYHSAELLGNFKTCSNNNSCVITDAAISPNEKKIALLGHDKIWILENFKGDDFLSGNILTLELNHYSQKEGICFMDNETLLIADEKNKKTGGQLYKVNLSNLKNSH